MMQTLFLRFLVLCGLLCATVLAFAQEPPMVVDIDIKPGSAINPMNVKSHGTTPVAILCSETFDPANIDMTTVTLGATAVPGQHCALEDVNTDGCLDLVCHFATDALSLACGTPDLTLNAALTDGTLITGTDVISTVPCKAKVK